MYYFNVTTSLNWQRPPVGIVRVETEVATFFVNSHPTETVLFAWNAEKQNFLVVKSHVYLSHLKSIATDQVRTHSPACSEQLIRPTFLDVVITMGLDWDHPILSLLHTLKRRTGTKIVTCCYDLIPVLFPQYCVSNVSKYFGEYFLDAASLSDHILCISQSSQRDLTNFLASAGLNSPSSSSVFRLGDFSSKSPSLHNVDDDSVLTSHGIVSDYILFVSTIERRKNHHSIYLAYRKILADSLVEPDALPLLVFVGMKGWGVEELLLDIELDPLVRDKILILDRVSDSDLEHLYKNCLFTVYPSFYEGWGLPVAESLCHGKVAICSNTSSIPEIGGDLLVYADPYSATDYAEKISLLCSNRELLSELNTRISKEYQPCSWYSTGKQVLNVCKTIHDALENGSSSSYSFSLDFGYDMSTYGGFHAGNNLLVPCNQDNVLIFGPHVNIPPGQILVKVIFCAQSLDGATASLALRSRECEHFSCSFDDLKSHSLIEEKLDGKIRFTLSLPCIHAHKMCSEFEIVIAVRALVHEISFESLVVTCIPSISADSMLRSSGNNHTISMVNKLLRLGRYMEAKHLLAESKTRLPDVLYRQKLDEVHAHLE
jgi:glycosyltransferase involved in cell wall biosynthesis